MSSWMAVLLSVPVLRKKESPIEAFKRTAVLAEDQEKKALLELEEAAKTLVAEIEKKVS